MWLPVSIRQSCSLLLTCLPVQDLGEDPPEGAPLSHAAAKAASMTGNASASHRYGGFDPAEDDDDDDISGFQVAAIGRMLHSSAVQCS